MKRTFNLIDYLLMGGKIHNIPAKTCKAYFDTGDKNYGAFATGLNFLTNEGGMDWYTVTFDNGEIADYEARHITVTVDITLDEKYKA